MFKSLIKDFVAVDHPLKKQMAKLLSMPEECIRFLPSNSKSFNRVLKNSKKTATVNLKSINKEYNLQLYTHAGAPIILDSSSETSYLVLRAIDIA